MNDSWEESTIHRVWELTRELKQCLEDRFASVWVRGEISNLRRQSSGHTYFTLKDEKSQISAVLFRGNATRIPFQAKDGQQVIVYGEITVYEPRGSYQILVRDMVEDGLGRLQREFERLKNLLQGEGLFAKERKRPLPELASTIGVVTSPTGAAIRDFISVLQRREWRGEVRVFPALVQGSAAADAIVQQIDRAQQMEDLDLLIVMRGGGSLEDLWPFNEEKVVRALVRSRIPTVSAVGHEIDFVLTDFAADHRSETPTAAAEWITSQWVKAIEAVREFQGRLQRSLHYRMSLTRKSLRVLSEKITSHQLRRRMEMETQRLDETGERLQRSARWQMLKKRQDLQVMHRPLQQLRPLRFCEQKSEEYSRMKTKLRRLANTGCEIKRQKMEFLAKRLQANGLEQTLQRGFALVRNQEGKPILNGKDLVVKQGIQIQMRDGTRKAKVEA